MLFVLFRPSQHFGKFGMLFFFFFFNIQFCIFKQNCWNNNFQNALKLSQKLTVLAQKIYLVTPYMSPPGCWLSLIQIQETIWFILHFFNIQIWKKKKIDLPTLPIFWLKGQTNLYFFRPYLQYFTNGKYLYLQIFFFSKYRFTSLTVGIFSWYLRFFFIIIIIIINFFFFFFFFFG